MKEVEVLCNLTEEGTLPEQGYENDFAADLYVTEGELIPPLTFGSIMLKTGLRTQFAPRYGMKINLRSGVASKTPLLLSNGTGIVEADYRGEIGILVRNSFIDNRPVDFVFNVKGERVPLNKVPSPIKKKARQRFEEELDKLGYVDSKSPLLKELFKDKVPCGTVYVAKNDRIAQAHLQERIQAKYVHVDGKLLDSSRGSGGFGSSGVTK